MFMAKGCGFIIICVIGFVGIAMLYYALSPLTSEETASVNYTDGYIADVIAQDDPTDTAYLKVIPVLEFSYEGSYYTDTAFHLARTTEKSGYVDDIGNFYYQREDIVLLEMTSPDDYQLAGDLPIPYIIQNLVKEWQTGLIIVGLIFTLIFLRGLSKTFAYKEPPRADRF